MLILFLWLVTTCSRPEETPPAPVPTTVAGETDWEKVKGITSVYCSRCHEQAAFLETEEAIKASDKIRGKLERRDMPPPSSVESRSMDQDLRDQLLDLINEE